MSNAKKKMAGPMGTEPARQTLELCAAAAGLSLEQLVNLVADSGVLALPPSDGATEVLSLDELGHHLRAQLSKLGKPDYPPFFRKLSPVQQGALIVCLRNQGASTTALSTNFDIPPMKVTKVFNEYADKLGQQATNVRLTTIVGHMQIVAERAQQGAMEKEDWSTYWRIQKELISQLQSLGIVDKAIHRVEVTHTLGDREKENIERLAALRLKQKQREEEIKRIDVTVEEAVPERFKESPE